MPEENRKLTPAEFLSELRAKATTNNDLLGRSATDTLDEPDPEPAEMDGSDESTNPETSDHLNGRDSRPAGPSGGDVDRTDSTTPDAIKDDAHLAQLFSRVSSLLGGTRGDTPDVFTPQCPQSIEDAGLTFEDVERLIMKFLFAKGSATGRQVCAQVRLPFNIVDPILKQLKQDQLLAFKGAATMGDFNFVITEVGRERARTFMAECTYSGPAPVPLQDYLEAMAEQSISKQHASEEDLREAFADLVISQSLLERLGPAVNSGRGMFLFGEPGNGKTSIAERLARSFGTTIWIPHALIIDGEIVRLFDPAVHDDIRQVESGGLFDLSGVDQRWVQIIRPTVIAGGELTMKELEVTQNPQTKICEAPLQLKSNCGTFVIDDFGRQRMPVEELLNRWIVPLEKRYDYLNLPSGKKVQVPFDQLIIFSTNLEPKDLVDGAFLRRIPYKIEVLGPTYEEFHQLFQLVAPMMGFEYDREAVDYLIDTHYKPYNRPFRACQPRDLLQQVKNFCTYKNLPKALTSEAFDFAIENYFSVI